MKPKTTHITLFSWALGGWVVMPFARQRMPRREQVCKEGGWILFKHGDLQIYEMYDWRCQVGSWWQYSGAWKRAKNSRYEFENDQHVDEENLGTLGERWWWSRKTLSSPPLMGIIKLQIFQSSTIDEKDQKKSCTTKDVKRRHNEVGRAGESHGIVRKATHCWVTCPRASWSQPHTEAGSHWPWDQCLQSALSGPTQHPASRHQAQKLWGPGHAPQLWDTLDLSVSGSRMDPSLISDGINRLKSTLEHRDCLIAKRPLGPSSPLP